jgi:cytochrome c oxidase subunit 2
MSEMLRLLVTLVAVTSIAACSADRPGEGPISGEVVAGDLGCLACHTDTDTVLGPTWNGIWGSSVELEDGSVVTVDEAYVRRSIDEPQADIVAGFSASMPPIPMSEEEESALVDYIESLG